MWPKWILLFITELLSQTSFTHTRHIMMMVPALYSLTTEKNIISLFVFILKRGGLWRTCLFPGSVDSLAVPTYSQDWWGRECGLVCVVCEEPKISITGRKEGVKNPKLTKKAFIEKNMGYKF